MQPDSKKTIRIFAIASFLNDLGSDIIYPLWPVFVTTFTGANMAVLGFIDGLGDAIVSISQAASGYLSDRMKKRKVFIWLGYAFGGASRLGYALSKSWPQLIPLRILDRAGKMRGAPRDAIIADISTVKNRGSNFGVLRSADNFGAVCGILISIFFIKILGLRTLFFLASIPSLIAVILIFLFIKERKSAAEIKIYKGLSFKDISANFRLFLFLSAVFSLGFFSYSFLLIFAKLHGFEIIALPVLYLLFTAVAAFSSLPFGRLADRLGRKKVMLVAFFLWILVCLSFIYANNFLLIIIGFIFYGLHLGAVEPVKKAFVSELSPEKFRASSLGGYQMITGLCALPASLLAGVLWEKFGSASPFYLSLALTLLASIMLIGVSEKKS